MTTLSNNTVIVSDEDHAHTANAPLSKQPENFSFLGFEGPIQKHNGIAIRVLSTFPGWGRENAPLHRL